MTHGVTAFLGTAVLLVAGCSNAASSPSRAPSAGVPSPATSRAASGGTSLIPPGRYTAEIPEGLEAAPGIWTMEVTPEAITWTNPGGTSFSPGELVEVTSTTIVFGPDPGCPDQEGGPTEGAYTWSVDGGQLTFTFASDSCLGRRDTLTAAPWEPAL